MNELQPTLRVAVDCRNPGEFFACCGLLELADRAWGQAEGWFAEGERSFCLNHAGVSGSANYTGLLPQLACCEIRDTMPEDTKQRMLALQEKGGSEKDRKKKLSPEERSELKNLEQRWRVEPILIGDPFRLILNWWHDDDPTAPDVKTWAGKQATIEIANAMKQSLAAINWTKVAAVDVFAIASQTEYAPFNFDAMRGAQSATREAGFSADKLELTVQTRPAVELLALIGLQRFRPAVTDVVRTYDYAVWQAPLAPPVARAAAAGVLGICPLSRFRFRLLCRDSQCRYKAFLPATRLGG